MRYIGAVFLVSLTGVIAGPIDWFNGSPTQCAVACTENGKFSYTPGQTYEYTFDSNIITHVPGATQDSSTLRLRANVRVEAISACEFSLKLYNTALEDSRGSVTSQRQFSGALEASTLRFAFDDGKIASICPGSSEETWVLNVKRGILSSFQNTMISLTEDYTTQETDVTGSCPVHYKVEHGKIVKVKNIIGCSENHQQDTVFHGIPYTTDSTIQSLPILKSQHECSQQIKNGIISQTTCTEKHVFRPFSRETSGATTEVTSTLTFSRQSAGITSQTGSIGSKLSLEYDFTPTKAEMDRSISDAQATLAELCKNSHDDIRPDVPSLFTRLIRDMRKLDADSLRTLYQQAKMACETAPKFFRDAIPSLGTAASVDIIETMIRRKLVTDSEADIWLTSQAFVSRPTTEYMQQAVKLMSLPNPMKRKAILAVSSLVNNYCTIKTDCENTQEVLNIIATLETTLSGNCNGDHDETILALKAIGNIGHASRLAPKITSCFQNTALPMETRVIAVTAFRRMSCDADRSALMTLFADTTMDAELRINAYLQIMTCPTESILTQVKTMLASEDINQVGSFVWTHLTNLVESSSPHKQDISKILADEKLQKTFDMDKRKFSRNIEWSMFSHLLNSGAAVESNIIFSEKSFIPRSGNMNLTVDMFGHSVNLLELGARIEGMDRVLEQFFGPEKGEPSKNALVDSFDKRFKGKPTEKPKAMYYMKMFGNEIRYGDLHNIDFESLKDKLNFLNWIIDLAEEHEVEVMKSASFMDISYTLPTSAGLPLILEADGSSSMSFKVKGKLDMRKDVDIQGTISPSGAVQITSAMGVDATFAKTQLKMVATLHTSTVVQGRLLIKDGNFVMDVDMPKDKIEIFDLQTKFFLEDREQQMLTDNVVSGKQCWSLKELLGIETCAEYSLPLSMNMRGPMFPFTGPTKMSLIMNKLEPLTGYHMEARYVQDKPNSGAITDTMRFAVSTPGSTINRDISVDLSVVRSTWEVKFNMKTPWKTMAVQTLTKNTPTKKSLSATMKMDEKDYVSFLLDMPIDEKPNGIEYSPSIDLSLPGMDSTKITSKIFINPGRKIEWSARTKNLPFFSDAIKTQGEIVTVTNNKRWKREVNMELTAGDLKGSVAGYVDNEFGNSVASRFDLSYAYGNAKERFTLSSKIKDDSTNTIMQYSMDGQWTSTMFKNYNGDMKGDFSMGRSNLAFGLDAGYSDQYRIKFSQNSNWQLQAPNKKVNSIVQLEIPNKNIQYEVKLDHSHTPSTVNSDLQWRLGGKIDGTLKTDLKLESMSPLKTSANIVLEYPGRTVGWTQTVQEVVAGEYRSDLDIQVDTYNHVILKSTYKMAPRHELSTTVKYGKHEPTQFLFFLKPDIRDIQAHAEMRHAQQKYSIETNLKTSGNFGDFTTAGNMDLQYGPHHVTLDGSMNSNSGVHDLKMSTKWDADRDSSEQASLNIKVATSTQQPQLYIRAECKTYYFIELDTNAKHETGNWWSEINDFQGTAKWKSSYAGWESAVFNFKHDIKNNGWTTHVEGSKGTQKMVGDWSVSNKGTWDDSETTLSLKTPFQGYSSIDASGSYRMRKRGMDIAAKATYEGKVLAMMLTSQINPIKHLWKVDVDIKTPFSGYEQITMNFNHEDDGKKFTTGLGGTLPNGKTLQYQQEVTLISGSTLTINMKFVSPFRGFERITVSTDNSKTTSSITGSHKITVNDRTWTLINEGEMNWPTVRGSITYTCPVGNSFKLNANHAKQGDAWISHADVVYGRSQTKIEFDNSFEWGTTKRLNTVVKCDSCPYLGTSSVLLELAGAPTNFVSKMELENTALLTDKLKLGVEINLDNLRDMRLKTAFSSPYGSSSLVGTHKKQGRQFLTSLAGELPGYTASIDNELNLKDSTNFVSKSVLKYNGKPAQLDLKLNTKDGVSGDAKWTVGTSVVGAKVSFAGQPTEFQTSAEVQLNRLSYKAQMTFAMKGNNIELTGDINSPLLTEHCQVIFRQGTSTYDVYSELEINGNRGTVTGNLNLAPITGSAKITTPYRGYDNMGLGFAYEVSQNTVKPSAEIYWSTSDKMTIEAEMARTRTGVTGSITITTPFRGFERIAGDMSHNGLKWTSFENQVTVNFLNNMYGMKNSFSLTGYDVTMASTVNVPQGTSTVKYSHQGSLADWDGAVEIDVMGKRGTANVHMETGSENLGLTATMSTPFEQARIASFSFNHTSKGWTTWKDSASWQVNSKKGDSSVDFKLSGNTLAVQCITNVLNTKYALNVRHNGPLNDFKTTVAVMSGNRRIKSQTTFRMQGYNVDALTELETPYSGYESSSISFKTSGDAQDYVSELRAVTPYTTSSPLTMKLTVAMRKGFNGELTMTSGFDTIRDAGVNVNLEGSITNFRVLSTAWVMTKKITTETSFSTGDSTEGSIKITTPFAPLKDFGGSFVFSGVPMKFTANGKVYWSDQITVNTQFNWQTDKMASIDVTTPIRGFENVGISYHMPTLVYRGDIMQYEHTLVMYWSNRDKIIVTQVLKSTGEQWEQTINIKTPFTDFTNMGLGTDFSMSDNGYAGNFEVYWTEGSRTKAHFEFYQTANSIRGKTDLLVYGMPNMGVTFSSTGAWKDMKSSGEIYWGPDSKISASSQFSLKGTTLKHTFSLSTPSTSAQTMSTSFDHSGNWDNFKNTAVLELNNKRVSATNSLQVTDMSFTASSDISTPFIGYERISAKYNHDMLSTSAFTCDGELTVGRKTGILRVNYDVSQALKRSSFELNLPFDSLKSLSASAEHEGTMKSFQNTATVAWNSNKITTTNNFRISGMSVVATSELSTPFDVLRTMSVKYDHIMESTSSFKCNGGLSINGQTSTVVMSYDFSDSLKIMTELTTPMSTLRQFKIDLEHNAKNVKNFKTTGAVELNNVRYTTDVNFKFYGTRLSSDVTIVIPGFDKMGMTVKHDGTWTKFENNLKLFLGDGQTNTYAGKFNMNGMDVDGSAQITVPYVKIGNHQVTILRKGQWNNFNAEAKLIGEQTGTYSAVLSHTHSEDYTSCDTTIKVMTPTNDQKITFTHAGTLNDFSSKLTMTCQDKTWEASASFKNDPSKITADIAVDCAKFGKFAGSFSNTISRQGFQSELSVQTPIRGYEQHSASITVVNSGTMTADITVDCTAWGKFVASFSNTINKQGFQSQLSIETPFKGYERSIASINVVNTATVDTADVRATVGPHAYSIAWMRDDNTRGRKESITIKTPKFVNNPSSYNGFDQYVAELIFARGGDVQINVRLESPFRNFESFIGTFTHVGDMSSFQTTADIKSSNTYMDKLGFSVNWKNSMPSNVEGKMEVRTPYGGFESFKTGTSFTKTMTSMELKSAIDTSIRGLEHFDVDVKGAFTGSDLSWDLSINTPFREYQSWAAQLKHSGDVNRFQTVATINTPIQSLSRTSVKISHDGGLEGFSSNAEYNGNTFDIRGSVKMSGVQLEITTPFSFMRNVEINAEHKNMKEGSVGITINRIKKVDFDYSVNLSETTSDIKMEIRQPTAMTMNMNFKNTNVQKDLAFGATLPDGRPITLTSKYTSDSEVLSNELNIQWNRNQASQASYDLQLSKKTLRNQMTYDGTISVKSPWYTQQASVSHTVIPNTQWTTQLVAEGTQRMVIRNEYVNSSPKWKNTFTIQHPQLTKEISIATDGIVDWAKMHIEGSLKATIETEELTFYGKIADESTRSEKRTVVSMKLSHPSTLLDLSFNGDCSSNDVSESHNMELKYTTSQTRRDITFSTKTRLDKTTSTFTLEMASPVATWKLSGKPTIVDRSKGIYEYTLNYQGEKTTLTIQTGFNWEVKELYAIMTMNEQTMKISGKYNTIRNMVFTITHQRNGQTVNDVVFSIYPTKTRVINIRKMIRPNCGKDFMDFMVKQLDTKPIVDATDKLMAVLRDDSQYKADLFKRRTMPVMKSVCQTLFGDKVANGLSKMMEKIAIIMESDKLYRAVHAHIEWIPAATEKLLTTLEHDVEKLMKALEDAYNNNFHVFDDMYQYAQDKVSSLVDTVQRHPITEKIINFTPQEWISNIRETGHRYHQTARQMTQGYGEYVAVASDVWSNVGRRMEVRGLSDQLKSIQEYGQWAYNHYQVEDAITNLAKQASMSTLMSVKDQSVDYLKGLFVETHVNDYDQNTGLLDVDIGFPDEWPTFEMPDIQVKEYIVALLEWIASVSDKMAETDGYSVMDLIFTYAPKSIAPEILPPFGGRASIAGGQNFITFDNTFYPYAGDCSYLLARDFIDGQFAVVINYSQANGKTVKKSLTVSTSTKQVEIFPDGSVLINGESKDLPLQFDNVTIRREGDSLKLDNTNGFQLQCNLGRDHCTITVTGWYYSKTAGMLGTFDHEPATDFQTADGSRTQDISAFASSWASGRRCTTTNLAKVQTANPGEPVHDICAAFFKDKDSPFRSCFQTINPDKYMEMCMNEMPVRRQETKHACRVMSLFAQECKQEGRTVNLPKECARCDRPDGTTFTEGTAIELKDDTIPRSADVVFVVEEAMCNNDVTTQLSDILTQMDITLKQKGLTNNRFGVVGYGGKGVHYAPNTHSFEGQIMTTAEKVTKGLQAIQMVGESQGDALKAIQLAAMYPFRTGVSKTVVLVTCNGCQAKSVSYASLVQLLQDRDVRLHVLLEHQYEVKGEAKQARTAYLFGHDDEGIFTFKNTESNLDSDKELFSHVQKPKDICAAAAIETQGTVFSASQLTAGRPDNQRRLVTVITNVWATSATPTKHQKCECVMDENNMGRTVCKNAHEKNFFANLFGFSGSSEESSSEEKSSEIMSQGTHQQPRKTRILSQ